MGCGSWCFSIDENGRKETIEILGSKGKIEFATFDLAPIKLSRNHEVTEINYSMPEHIQMPFIETIVPELLGKGHCPGTGESAARTCWVMDKIFNV